MSSPKTTNCGMGEKSMHVEERATPSPWHERGDQRAGWRQATALSLTPQSLQGEKKDMPSQGQKTATSFCFLSKNMHEASENSSSRAFGMHLLSGFKRLSLIAGLA